MLVLRSQVIILAIKYIFHSDICKNQAMEVNARNEKKKKNYVSIDVWIGLQQN